MSLINVANLTFAYDGSYDNIFEDVSFQLDTDWRLGFTGRNGRGKTTFLRLLTGELEYSGTISSSVKFEYFPYSVANPNDTTQQVVESTGGDWQQWELERELSLLGVSETLERPFCTLSKGEQTKVLLAALFLRSNSFLLIDEPTNHLDAGGRLLLRDYLRHKSGFILVSHDRRFLDGCVDHILAINRRNIEVCRGSFSTWYENKQRQDSMELAENERLRGDIKRLTAATRRTAGWSDKLEKSKIGDHCADRGFVGHKSAKMMQRAKNIERRQQTALEKKSTLLRNVETAEELKLHSLSYHKQRMAELRGVTISYDGRAVCGPLTFEVLQGERIALRGHNGSGKSSVLRLLMGETVPYTGLVELGSGLKISYVPQDTSFLCGSLDDFADEQGIDHSLFKAILRKLDFARVQFEKPLEDYSGGQKKKVLIAASMSTQAHLYIWDEPLNFIDVFSRMQLESLIASYSPTIVFVEHDEQFTENTATKVINM